MQNLIENQGDQLTENYSKTLEQEQSEILYQKLKLEQNLPFAIISGLTAAIIGGVLWATITVSTNYQIGYMAVAIGLLTGYAIKYSGKGIDRIFGIIGAIMSLFGCLLGNFLSTVGFVAQSENLTYSDTILAIDYSYLPEIMMDTFSPIDLLFYGIAIYEGYRFSFYKTEIR